MHNPCPRHDWLGSSHSTCMALTLAFQSTCNAIPRNSMIMQGIPIANAWQTPPGASLCFCPLCGIRQARPSKRTVYAWQSLCITLGYFAVCSPCVSWQSLGYGEGYTKVRSEGTSHGNAQAGKGCRAIQGKHDHPLRGGEGH